MPIDIEITDEELVRPTMVSVNNTVNKNVIKQRAVKRKMLEKQLSENTARMSNIKEWNKL